MEILWAVILAIVVLACWSLNVLGLPGNWLVLLAGLGYVLLMPADSRVSVGWPVLGALTGLAFLGEAVEFVAGAAGSRKAGGTRRAAVLAIVGGFIGAVIGAVVGLPLPVIGSVVAALLFSSGGSLAGAVLGETWAGRSAQQSWQVGQAAFWGRLLGTMGKILVGAMMVAVILVALVVK